MAETKKVAVQTEEKPEQTVKQETKYAVSELIAASDQLFLPSRMRCSGTKTGRKREYERF